MAKLHRLTEFCDYGEALEGMLRDRLRANTTSVTQ